MRSIRQIAVSGQRSAISGKLSESGFIGFIGLGNCLNCDLWDLWDSYQLSVISCQKNSFRRFSVSGWELSESGFIGFIGFTGLGNCLNCDLWDLWDSYQLSVISYQLSV
jgi:hypothetical protein